jgi:N-acetylated-alpha-linked acidic dipeptidase
MSLTAHNKTVLIASWDAEEYGIIGSTEYGEDFAEWITEHAVAYLNVDVGAAGSTWGAASSPLLSHLVRRTAMDVAHPSVQGKTLWDAREDTGPLSVRGGVVDVAYMVAFEAAESSRQDAKAILPPLGSGSDFTVFLHSLGVSPILVMGSASLEEAHNP